MFFLGSCNITKHVENNQLLLVKNKVKVEAPLNPEIAGELSSFYKQRPNENFLGLFKTKLFFFNWGSAGKKDNGMKRFFRDKLGEPPIIIDSVYIESTTRSIKSYLKTKGHYYSDVKYDVKKTGKKKGKVIYHIYPGNYYRFGNYEMNIADKDIYDLVLANADNSLIITGKRFDWEVILKEKERIVDLLRNNGYYAFTKDFIEFDTDTALGNWTAYIALNIKNKSDYEPHKKYFINNIIIEVDKNNDDVSKSIKDSVPFKSFTYIPNQYELNPEILSHNLFLQRGDLFKQLNLTRSYGRLSDLNIFKFVNVNADVNDTGIVGKLDFNIRLMPSIKYFYTIEPQAITSDQNNTLTNPGRSYGIAATLQFNNRNVFRNAEIFQLTYRTSFEAQGKVSGGKIFNATQQSLTASIIMPRILFFPFFDRNINFLSTKSTINTSLIYELNVDYQRQVATSGLTYQFNKKLISYYFAPIEFSYIRSTLQSDTLIERAKTDIFLQNFFSNYVIMDSRFGFSLSNKSITKRKSYFFLRWDALEIAGNSLTAINELLNKEKSSNGQYQLLGLNYFQYAKSAIDFRYNTIYDKNKSTACRFFTGIIVPYGNSPIYTPFDKRFFVGGANSLRAWKPRSIGPGSYVSDYQIDHSGDIKIEMNAEYRFNIYNHWLEGVLFSDAGNIWGIKDDKTLPGAEFNINRFYKEIAVDAGVGIRLNFTIIIIRFDLAIPIRDPSFAEPDRWVIKNFTGRWAYDNSYLNFGIGYPF